ncbi:conserved hypothetical protein, partial [Ricinus communis]
AVLASHRPVVGRIARGARGRAAFPVRVPVIAADQFYTLTAVIRPDRMLRLIERQQVPGGAITAIRDGTLAVVARSQNPESAVAMPPSPSLVALVRANGAEGIGNAITSEGQPMTAAYSTSPHYGWVAVVARPAGQRDAAALQSFGVYGAGILVSLLLCIGLALLLSRRLVEAINALQHNAAALAAGAPVVLTPSAITEIAGIGKGLEQAGRQRAAQERERKLLLDTLNQALDEARRAGRAKDEFLAVLGHELRNPLSPIVTSLDLLDGATTRPAARNGR